MEHTSHEFLKALLETPSPSGFEQQIQQVVRNHAKTFADEGRYGFTKTQAGASVTDADRGAFKTPTLRDVARHAPYMHDGSMATLRDVVEYYNRGGNVNPYMDPKMPAHPLELTPTEVDSLVAMLESLSGTGYEDKAPGAFPK